MNNVENLGELKSVIVGAVRSVPGALSDPAPEVFVMDLNAPGASAVKLGVLWWSHDPRQHQMLGSYDNGLTAIVEALGHHRSKAMQIKAA